MSGGLLKALRSDSYVELSQYRDQHFRAGNLRLALTFPSSRSLIPGAVQTGGSSSGVSRFPERYYSRADAENAMRYINGTRLDDRIIRTDWDAGFKEGRQYGRGRSGGQVRDEYRQDYDAGRGGYGKLAQNQ
ncbi:hypothetical protein J1605_008269 [Eschrichtius robustus]|uniref:Nuclear cap-binding protein subunit 2 n=1 Tax=Eschrichtius robustus TaxID=9764 RepID=A0AB34H166_ESCRO|nr:hypothetical protein J1605_008269 [Eschrichtius robustus]